MLEDVIDVDRIQRRLDDVWAIGRTEEGGVTRLAYSEEERAAFEYLESELPGGYDVEHDSMGNLYATPSPDTDRTTLVGSHLDTVFNGGRLDGVLGVMVALEAIQAVDAPIADRGWAPTLAVFRGEESARFGQHTIGSRGALAQLTVDDFSRTDQNDVPLWLAMQRVGLKPTDLSEPTIDLDRINRFYEVHIEQGRVLEAAEETLGVVTSIRAPVRYRVTVSGAYDHSGATPMELRSDAVAAVARLITEVERAATDDAAEEVVATVGDVAAHDGAINTVCGEVTFPLDVRSHDRSARARVEQDILDRFHEIESVRDVSVELEELDRTDPVRLDGDAVDALDAAVDSLGVPYRRMPSGGGHDAMNFQTAGVPTGMLFVPSIDGVSHSPDEATPTESIRTAATALAETLAAEGDRSRRGDA